MTKKIKQITAKYPSILALLLLGLSNGCSRKPTQVGPPPPEVIVATVMSQDIAVEREGVATLEGFITATINAQMQGYLISRDYKEGRVVKKGDLLFQIDPRPYEAALAQAQGNLATAGANQVKSKADVQRAIKLFEGKVISDQERDTSINAASVGKANVQAAEAAARQAEINLGYTKITSPIDGIVGIAKAQVGDLVGPATGALTTISQVDPIKAAISLGEQSFTEFLTNSSRYGCRERYLKGLRFNLVLANGTVYPHQGEFYAEDRNLDTQTGTIRVELTFPIREPFVPGSSSGKYTHGHRTTARRFGYPTGSGDRLQGPHGRRRRSRQQSNHAPGNDGRAHRRNVAGHERFEIG